MDMAGRIMDTIAEAPHMRRAKASAAHAPASDQSAGQTNGMSFSETLIGIVQPPTTSETPKASSDVNPTSDGPALATLAPKAESAAQSDGSAMMMAAVPLASVTATPLTTPISEVEANAAAVAGQAQSAALTLGLTSRTIAGANPSAPETASQSPVTTAGSDAFAGVDLNDSTEPTAPAAQPSADTTTAQALALKTQANASQSLLAGLAALGQTQDSVTDDSNLAQLIAKSATPAAAQSIQPSLLPDGADAVPATSSAPVLAVAGTAQGTVTQALGTPQGPSAVRALEAQSTESQSKKTMASGFTLTNGSALFATDEAGQQSLAPTAPLAATGQQVTAAATPGLMPNLAKTAGKTEDSKVAATDATGLLGGSSAVGDTSGTQTASLDGSSTPAQDTTPKPSLVQPHTLPMLAAAMMRRISNGLKEFTLRLDPPELGRVDVRLTVGTDKKVRAVVSTDRPEALKDLALSARDLTRALQEAGLDLEENGLSFSMNDQGSSQQNRDAHQRQSAQMKHSLDGYDTNEAASPEPAAPRSAHLSGPVERWQRARIALTV